MNDRRDFLKMLGIGGFVASVHNVDRVVNQVWLSPEPNIIRFTVNNLVSGDSIAIIDAETGNPLFIGRQENDIGFATAKMLIDGVPDRDVIVRVRNANFREQKAICPFETHAGLSTKIPVIVTRINDF